MNYSFTFKNRNYSHDASTDQTWLVTDGGGRVLVSLNHPALSGLREHIKESVLVG